MPRLGCFQVGDTAQAGVLGRLLGRKLRENCFIEIQNLLATRELSSLAAADVENLLSEYAISRPQASGPLLDLYRTAVKYLAREGLLSESDRGAMKHLHYVLGLNDAEVREAELDVLREVYRARLQSGLRDSHLSDTEKTALVKTASSFGLDPAVQQEVYKLEVLKVVQQTFDASIADRRLTPDEDRRLVEMAANFGVTWTHDEATQKLVERFRLFGRISSGDIPEIQADIRLQRGEKCYAQFQCRLLEKRSVTRAIRYSGPSGRIRIMKGLSWRYGYVNVNRVTTEELRQLDTGVLYLTSKRLVFNGQSKNLSVPYKKIIHFTLYKDGVQIEKDSGRDPYFMGEGDVELLGVTLEAALTAFQAN
jgi:hypothetical protein